MPERDSNDGTVCVQASLLRRYSGPWRPARYVHWFAAATLVLLSALFPQTATAQSYPARPIRLIVPFPPGGTIATVPYVLLARHGSGLTSVSDLLTSARQKPGALNYGSAGTGSTSHLAAASFVAMAGGVPGYEMSTWHTVCAPRGTPPPIIERLNREIVAAISEPAVRDRFLAAGTEPGGNTFAELRARIEQEVPRWENLLTQLGLRGK